MKKETFNYWGTDYVFRILDIRSLPGYERECYANVKVSDIKLEDDIERAWREGDYNAWFLDEEIFFYADSEFINSDPTDEELLDYLRKNLCEEGHAYDANSCEIQEGDRVLWRDPETGNTAEYVVYEKPTEDMVKLWSDFGECEALPKECVIRMKKFNTAAAPEELDFYTIEEDESGNKMLQIIGYTYYGDNWKYIQARGICLTLSEFVEGMQGSEDYVQSLYEWSHEYERDVTDAECVSVINHLFDGKPADYRLKFEDVTLDTPVGNYVSWNKKNGG